jgi:hypothetical protein
MRGFAAARATLLLGIVSITASPFAAGVAAPAENVLVIPAANADHSSGLRLLAQVSVRIRAAELSRLTCSASPDAEMQYQGALQALIDGHYQSAIAHLQAADELLSTILDLRGIPQSEIAETPP